MSSWSSSDLLRYALVLARSLVTVILVASTAWAATNVRRAESRPYDISFLPRAEVVRWIAFGHPTFAANVYWLRAVQYIGEPRGDERGWDRLYPTVDLVTNLDPKHGYAYQVAGIILGSVGRISESNAILEKGMDNVPDRYILPYLRAFNAFYYAGDFAEAGRLVERAARIPGAPDHLRQTALAFYVKGNEATAAVEFLQQLRAEARDEETARALDDQLKQAYLERDAAQLEAAVRNYSARTGTQPLLLEELVSAGVVSAIPPDPFGGVYVLGADGRVRSTKHSFRYKRADEIERTAEPGVHAGRAGAGAELR